MSSRVEPEVPARQTVNTTQAYEEYSETSDFVSLVSTISAALNLKIKTYLVHAKPNNILSPNVDAHSLCWKLCKTSLVKNAGLQIINLHSELSNIKLI